jgi:hypothetical protein
VRYIMSMRQAWELAVNYSLQKMTGGSHGLPFPICEWWPAGAASHGNVRAGNTDSGRGPAKTITPREPSRPWAEPGESIAISVPGHPHEHDNNDDHPRDHENRNRGHKYAPPEGICLYRPSIAERLNDS